MSLIDINSSAYINDLDHSYQYSELFLVYYCPNSDLKTIRKLLIAIGNLSYHNGDECRVLMNCNVKGIAIRITSREGNNIKLTIDQLIADNVRPYIIDPSYHDQLSTYDDWVTIMNQLLGDDTPLIESSPNSTLTHHQFKNRLLEAVRDDDLFVFHGQSIPNLIDIAKIISPKRLIIEPTEFGKFNCLSDDYDVTIVTQTEDCSIKRYDDNHIIVTEYTSYWTNPGCKIVVITDKNESQIREWKLLHHGYQFKVIEFSEPIPVPDQVVHQFVKF